MGDGRVGEWPGGGWAGGAELVDGCRCKGGRIVLRGGPVREWMVREWMVRVGGWCGWVDGAGGWMAGSRVGGAAGWNAIVYSMATRRSVVVLMKAASTPPITPIAFFCRKSSGSAPPATVCNHACNQASSLTPHTQSHHTTHASPHHAYSVGSNAFWEQHTPTKEHIIGAMQIRVCRSGYADQGMQIRVWRPEYVHIRACHQGMQIRVCHQGMYIRVGTLIGECRVSADHVHITGRSSATTHRRDLDRR